MIYDCNINKHIFKHVFFYKAFLCRFKFWVLLTVKTTQIITIWTITVLKLEMSKLNNNCTCLLLCRLKLIRIRTIRIRIRTPKIPPRRTLSFPWLCSFSSEMKICTCMFVFSDYDSNFTNYLQRKNCDFSEGWNMYHIFFI